MGEKPEDIDLNIMVMSSLHWIVIIVNDVIDRFHQWINGV